MYLRIRARMEDHLMQRVEKSLAHGPPHPDEQFGIHVGLSEQHLQCGHVAVGLLRQPFDIEATALQAFLQEMPRMEIDESVVGLLGHYFV